MNEPFYHAVRDFGRVVFGLASDPRILHPERAGRTGAFLLAANHSCIYDAPLVIAATSRVIHWLSIVELFRNPFSRWFMTQFGALPLDRSRPDLTTVRRMMRLLATGQVVAMFPEGRMRLPAESVLAGGGIDPGICQIAQRANVPVVPCVVRGSEQFLRWQRWLPGAGVRWAVAFGEPIYPPLPPNRASGQAAMAEQIARALRGLDEEIRAIGYIC